MANSIYIKVVWLCLVVAELAGNMAFAQKTKKADLITVEGEATYFCPKTQTRAEGEYIALKKAKLDALKKEFGEGISANTHIRTLGVNEQVYKELFQIYNNSINGVWVEDINAKHKYAPNEQGTQITCTVRGKAKEIDRSLCDIKAELLHHPDDQANENYTFKSGEQFYFSFESQESGYLSIFYLDPINKRVERDLPYSTQLNESCIEVEANKHYVFFDRKNPAPANYSKDDVSEMVLQTDQEEGEMGLFYVLFSQEPLPALKIKNGGEQYAIGNYATPYTEPEDFEKWKNKIYIQDPTFQVKEIFVIIKKEENR